MDFNTQPIWLVYKDEDGNLFTQPLMDMPEVGTLIDDDGNDMELVGWRTYE